MDTPTLIAAVPSESLSGLVIGGWLQWMTVGVTCLCDWGTVVVEVLGWLTVGMTCLCGWGIVVVEVLGRLNVGMTLTRICGWGTVVSEVLGKLTIGLTEFMCLTRISVHIWTTALSTKTTRTMPQKKITWGGVRKMSLILHSDSFPGNARPVKKKLRKSVRIKVIAAVIVNLTLCGVRMCL